ncbi:hypothetical protein [Noviherbaspirillum sp. UKPF54]|uniref:hypothetical protein n=1 Tax=Noviherbaspirillum sp. UKPF54 TaxID=2601898 RepID=UPI0011B17948|nr:hypothetical protein [Noviherbaspirillum sp. UKPF54]QDZ29540.1 hypothetical protein FAY22_17175 [Noviherbaspirillum sp. UKPF54]
MKTQQLFSIVVAALFSGLAMAAPAQDSAQEQSPFAAVPFLEPQPLQELIALDDGEFLRRLFDARQGSRLVDRLFPAELTIFPLSHGFAGAQDACLRMRTPQACRLYLHDLVTINEDKLQQNRVLSNPFAPAR